MKNFDRTTVILLFVLTLVLACTKDIDLKTQVEFSITEQHQAQGYINEGLPTMVTVVPEEILEEFSYSYSYSVSKGEGYFGNGTDKIFSQNENIAMNPLSATVMYVGSTPGEHIVKVIATDNYGFTEEVQLDYNVAEIPPVIWTATSPVQRIELGNSAPITITFEKSEAHSEANYERRYRLGSGSGMLTQLTDLTELDWDGFKPIDPGIYLLNFTPDKLGTMELFFDLREDDSSEFQSTLTFEVLDKIVDTIVPQIILLGDTPFTVPRGGNYQDPGATATDDVDGDITGDIIVDASRIDMSLIGTYQVTYNVSDSAGNDAAEVTRTVEVVQGEVPLKTENDILSFALPGQEEVAVIHGVDHTVTLSVPFGTDIHVEPIALTVSEGATVSPAINELQNFDNPVTYSVTSERGDEQEWVIKVRVDQPLDSVPPVITIIGNNPQIIEVGGVYNEMGATATDNLDGDITMGIIINSDLVNTDLIGEYLVTYNVKDASGNAAQQATRTVRVNDTKVPLITLMGSSVTISVGESYIEPGYSASDDYDGDITDKVVVGGNLDTFKVGTYTVTYDVSDLSGNAAEQTSRTVSVIDTTPPVIALTGGSTTMGIGGSYNDPGYSATDNVDGDLSSKVVVGGNLNINALGTYLITYDVSDLSGNKAIQATRTVQVIDDTPPVINLVGGTVSMKEGRSFTEPGYSANDNVDGDITGKVTIGGNLNTRIPNTYTLTYTVSDLAGNVSLEKSRTVIVDPIVTSFESSTGIYTAPAGSTVRVSLFSGGEGSGTASASGGGGSIGTCWGGGNNCIGNDGYTFNMPASGSVSLRANHSVISGSNNSSTLTITSNDETVSVSMNPGAAGTTIPSN